MFAADAGGMDQPHTLPSRAHAAPAEAAADAALDGLLALLAASGASAPRRRLLQAHPDPSSIPALPASALRQVGLDAAQIAELRQPSAARMDAAHAWLAQPGRRLLSLADADYPPLLRQLPDAPLALWLQGDPALLWRPAVAVVGSRAATGAGCDNAAEFAAALARAGLVVCSGLARGIDAAAHRAALAAAGGLTVAVIGTGVDVAYPASHAGLQQQIGSSGAVLSELWPGTGPLPGHFPQRNRIIAGLSLAVLVVEAAERSGALITARLAAAAGREVMALPGSIRNPNARGCHRLLRDGAQLVASPQELIDALAPQIADHARLLREQLGGCTEDADGVVVTVEPSAAVAATRQGGPAASQLGAGTGHRPPAPSEVSAQAASNAEANHADLDVSDPAPSAPVAPAPAPPACSLPGTDHPDYHRLWSALDFDPTALDELTIRSGLTVARVSAILPLMELQGRVRVEHGRYSRRR